MPANYLGLTGLFLEIGQKTHHVAKLHDGAGHKWQGRAANIRWRYRHRALAKRDASCLSQLRPDLHGKLLRRNNLSPTRSRFHHSRR